MGSFTPHGDDSDGGSLAVSLTPAEAAAILGVTPQAVRNYVNDGRLQGYRLGDSEHSRIRIPSSALAVFMRDTRAPIIERRFSFKGEIV